MARRIHVSALHPGEIQLDDSQAHHLRDVLRLKIGSSVELFDDVGKVAAAIVTRADPTGVAVRVEAIEQAASACELVIASAVPKGERADWMIEKLSELGVSRFIPLRTERSVVHPKGSGKLERWLRIATESAKQSRRVGVMQMDELTDLANVALSRGLYLSTNPGAKAIHDALCSTGFQPVQAEPRHGLEPRATEMPLSLALYIGPEGGWTDGEIARFEESGLTGVKLTATILRVETAAIAAAAIAATLLARR